MRQQTQMRLIQKMLMLGPPEEKNEEESDPDTVTLKKILLIIDDEPVIAKFLLRRLTPCFDAVITASTPAEAEKILSQVQVSHIVSDYYLGPNQPNGFQLIAKLRAAHPHIDRAVVFSGEFKLPKNRPHGVNAVVRKSADVTVEDLMWALRPGNGANEMT